jgi:hypothetical protein
VASNLAWVTSIELELQVTLYPGHSPTLILKGFRVYWTFLCVCVGGGGGFQVPVTYAIVPLVVFGSVGVSSTDLGTDHRSPITRCLTLIAIILGLVSLPGCIHQVEGF